MSFSAPHFIGIDPSSSKKPFGYAILDDAGRLMTLADGELDDVLALLRNQETAVVAVCAPSRPNQGLVRQEMEKQTPIPNRLRGVDMRMVEYELRQRGIAVAITPGREELCAAWVQVGIGLYRMMVEMGYKPYSSKAFPRQFIETHPHAVFCVLLGQNPLPKPSLEGRLQRQLVLYENGLGIKDPMDFFEEITRHRLLRGVMPEDIIYTPEQLDVIAAAYTAYLASTKPEEVSSLGPAHEGKIVLPIKELKQFYP